MLFEKDRTLANRNNIIKSWKIILSDYSDGMLETTRKSLSRLNYNFQYEIVNAENIQLSNNTFDVILANNMLYHIQNRYEALKNISRILKDNGTFIASTMGKNDLIELHNYLYQFLENKGYCFTFREFVFSLDNGIEQLSKYFKNITMKKHDNKLKINGVEAIINYYISFNEIHENMVVLPEKYVNEFREYLTTIIEREKEIIVTKDEGIFICKK
ncbi:MAG: class I SAM-dependent methyltransferase [Spirochaetaceae bacterium]|nr:class I SAM-dependent methyltransferase [Spirochaetaceae bacterium]